MSDNKALGFKRKAIQSIVEAFDKGHLQTHAYRIPHDVVPRNANLDARCCVYKERAVFRARILAALGFAIEQDDEATSLNEYAKQAFQRNTLPEKPLTVLDIACKACVKARHIVTEACQGCLTRPCQTACKFGAVSVVNGKSRIDPDKCKNCGMCKDSCPYNAITYVPVPCEQACPVDAIHKGPDGFARIDFEKCIACGQCIGACPFGAIMERSQLVDILRAMQDKKVCALVAPSVVGQLDCTLGQLFTALKQAGFTKTTEVAEGADITTANEARELIERLENGAPFMTTSCCAAWVEAVKKHLPELKEFISHTRTPVSYTAETEKKNGFTTVFIGPCVSKRVEGMQDPHIDFVMTYEELGSLLEARGINPSECPAAPLKDTISKEARYYGVTGGVAQAVENALSDKQPIKKMTLSGLDKKALLLLKAYATQANDFQLLEVMSCKGGCIGGPCTIATQAKVIEPIKRLAEASPKVKPAFEEKN